MPELAPKYLRQLGTGRVLLYTEALAKRKDMAPFDPDAAATIIEQKKKRLEELRQVRENPDLAPKIDPKVLSQSDELAKIERLIEEEEGKIAAIASGGKPPEDSGEKTGAQLEEERRQKIIDEDPDLALIEGMKKAEDLDAYAKENFGVTLDLKKKIPALKAEVAQLRVQRLFEA